MCSYLSNNLTIITGIFISNKRQETCNYIRDCLNYSIINRFDFSIQRIFTSVFIPYKEANCRHSSKSGNRFLRHIGTLPPIYRQ